MSARTNRRSRRSREAFAPSALERIALAMVNALNTPLRSLGIDVPALRTLLSLELALADRRRTRQSAEGSPSPTSYGLALSLLMNVLLGAFAAGALFAFDDPLWGIAIAQFVLMAFTTLMLITDYLPSLVDTADIDVIGATPVDDRTVLAARVAHAMLYLGVSTAALGLVPAIAGAAHFGPLPFLPIWILACALAGATCAGLSFGMFLLLLRVFDVERFRDALLWGQIVATVAFIGGFQIVPRLLASEAIESLGAARSWWLLLLPPFHTAGLVAVANGDTAPITWSLAALAFLVPIAAAFFLFRFASQDFVAHLSAMATGSRSATTPHPRRRPVRDLLLKDPIARAGYDYFAALSRRERQFRMRAYPAIAVALVISGVLLFTSDLPDPRFYCGAIYYLGMFAPLFVITARYSEDYEARWLFQSAPVKRYGPFLLGSFTALITTFVAPVVLAVAAILIAVGGTTLIVDVLFAAGSLIATTAFAVYVLGKDLPFTHKPEKKPQSGQLGLQLVLMFGSAIWIVLHFTLGIFRPALWLALLALPVVTWALLRSVRNLKPRIAPR